MIDELSVVRRSMAQLFSVLDLGLAHFRPLRFYTIYRLLYDYDRPPQRWTLNR
jgi:hypothetical protein